MITIRRILILVCAACFVTSTQAQDLRPEANKKGKFGYVNNQGEKVISYKYDEAAPFEEGLAKVKKGDKYGFINPDGKAVGKIKYTIILPFTGTYCRVAVGGKYKDGVLKDEKWGFLNKRGEEILPAEYDEIGNFEDGVTYVIKGDKYGIVDEQGNFLLEPKYTAVGLFDSFGYCWFAESGKINKKTGKLSGAKYGIIDRSGKIIIPAKFGSLGYFYRFKTKGDQTIEGFDANTSSYFGGYALEKPLRRLFDPQNYLNVMLSTAKTKEKADSLKTLFENIEFVPNSDYLYYSKDGIGAKGFLATAAGASATAANFGVISSHGDILIKDNKFDLVNYPSDGIAMVGKLKRKKWKYSYYNIETGYLKEFESNESLSSYTEGVAKVTNNDDKTCYFVDKSGNRVTEIYRFAKNFSQGLCIVQNNTSGKFGIIDTQGNTVIPFEYDDVKPAFVEDLLGVCKNEKWGCIDRSGKMVIPLIYKGVTDCTFGWITAVDMKNKVGIVDKKNQVVLDFVWDNSKQISEKEPQLIWVKKDDLWYCYDRIQKDKAFEQGYEGAVNFQMNNVLKKKYATVLKDDKLGSIDTQGNIIIPFVANDLAIIKKMLDYMAANGKTVLNHTDAFRLSIKEDASVNSYRITDTIPNDKWDY